MTGAVDTPARAVHTPLGRIGVRDLGDGPPLLLLTGFGATLDHWPPDLVDALAVRHRVLVADPPGVGLGDDLAGPPTVASMSESAAALLDALGTGPAAVLGWSMGGMVAQSLAVRRPDLTGALVLVAATAGVDGATGPTEAALAALTGPDPRRMVGVLFPGDRDAAAAYVTGILRYPDRHEVPDAVRAAQGGAIDAWRRGTDPDGARIGAAGVPALLVAGGRDEVAPPPNHALLASLLPEAEQYVDPDAGHGVAFRDPAGFAGRVVSFLAGVRDSAAATPDR